MGTSGFASILAIGVLLIADPCLGDRGNGHGDGWIRGITLAPIEDSRLGDVGYGSEACDVALREIAALGADWVSLTPFGRMDHLEGTEVLPDFEIPVADNERMIRKTAAMAKALGLRVALFPHVYVMNGKWRGEIDPGGSEAFREWFSSYEDYLLPWAELAEDVGADLFSIGVEFKSSTNFYPLEWRNTIARVRDVYSGLLTYSANWDEYEFVEFWDALDLIGINAFWPLAGKPGDGYQEMRSRAAGVALELERFSALWDRPVLFSEFGVKSARDAALAPWEWPENCAHLEYDETYQSMAYDAVFEIMIPSDWFFGLFIWKYFSDPDDDTQEERAGFSPRGKLAEQVLAGWFGGLWI